jgi:very-short-patch-repair endonuclease
MRGAGGPAAVLSHTNALQLWGLLPIDPPRPVHVSIPDSGRGRRPGIAPHRTARLAEDERTVVHGIKITRPARTIVDVAGMLSRREVERALATAERQGLVGTAELAGLPDRYPRRPGMPMLRTLLREQAEPHLTRSEAERRCLDLLRAAGLPRPHTNVPIGPYELDLFWPKEGVAVEIDGYAYHASRPRFEGDRRKDAWLRGRGIEVIRLTWRQITRDATATAVLVGRVLALASARRLPVEGEGDRS